MPRGKNYVNNNKGMAMKVHKRSDKVEMCFYGAGCTRKDCIYRHPTKTEANAKKSKEPCMAFIAGVCSFGAKTCAKRHPSNPEEVERLRKKYESIPCRYGKDCKTKGCLFIHPTDVPDENAFPPLVSPAVTGFSPAAPVQPPAPSVIPGSAWRPAPPQPKMTTYASAASPTTSLSADAKEFVPGGF